MGRILFLSRRDAGRSQMAAGFARARRDPDVEVFSAGIERGALLPAAVRAMGEVGVDIGGRPTRTIEDIDKNGFDVIVGLCDEALQACPVFPGDPPRINWNIPDPAAMEGRQETVLAAFRQTRDTIRRLVDDFFGRGCWKALDAVHRRAALVLDNVSDGILAHDLQRRIFSFNRAAEEITGYRREDVLNRDCHEIFPGGLCGGRCRFNGAVTPDFETATQELDIATRGGDTKFVRMNLRVMKDDAGKREGVLVAFHDATRERRMARRLGEIHRFSGIVGRDVKMLEMFDLIRDVADTSVPVLIQGESGTGKELVAEAVHNESRRAKELFVPVNCGALPESLLESELFGHVKGAFTGAIRDKKGRFELADKGTIFLDEIGDIAPGVQIKLLRVLQEGRFERVGSEQSIRVDVRVVSATNRDLNRAIEEGKFREDLYYRLNVVPIFLPALRERRNDIPLLTDHVLKRFLDEMNRAPVTVAPETMDVLLSHDWPGNVRELENWIQFALVKCRGDVIRPEHLPPATRRRPAELPAGSRKLDVDLVQTALREANGNKVEAARLLNVSRATLYRFLKRAPLR